MILVTGASGAYGSAIVSHLLRKGVRPDNITGLTRSITKAGDFSNRGIKVALADYNDYRSMVRAFKQVDKLMFVPGRDLARRMAQHEMAVLAAKEARVKHVVYASYERKNNTGASPLWLIGEAHLLMEELLRTHAVPYTILKNNLYMDFIPDFIGRDIWETGVLRLPAGSGKISAALRAEMAEAAATVLSSPGHEGRNYDITNTEAWNYEQIAAFLSDLSGKAIEYLSPPTDEFINGLKDKKVPGRIIDITVAFALAQAAGDLDTTSADLYTLIGRKPVSLPQYLREFYWRRNRP
jgi:NAD(P)H dehydrogenase (quinone)